MKLENKVGELGKALFKYGLKKQNHNIKIIHKNVPKLVNNFLLSCLR